MSDDPIIDSEETIAEELREAIEEPESPQPVIAPLRTIDLTRARFGHELTVTSKVSAYLPAVNTTQVFGYNDRRIAFIINSSGPTLGTPNNTFSWNKTPLPLLLSITYGAVPGALLMFDWTIYGILVTQPFYGLTDLAGDVFFVTELLTDGYLERK